MTVYSSIIDTIYQMCDTVSRYLVEVHHEQLHQELAGEFAFKLSAVSMCLINFFVIYAVVYLVITFFEWVVKMC